MTSNAQGYNHLSLEDFTKVIEEMAKYAKYDYSEDQRDKCLASHHFLQLPREDVLKFAEKFNLMMGDADTPTISCGIDSVWTYDLDSRELVQWTLTCLTIVTDLTIGVQNDLQVS